MEIQEIQPRIALLHEDNDGLTSEVSSGRSFHAPDALQSIRGPRAKGPVSGCTTHTRPAHACARSSPGPRRTHGGSSVEPIDLLAALVDEAESRAAELMAQFGLDPARVLNALGMEPEQSRREIRPRDATGEAR